MFATEPKTGLDFIASFEAAIRAVGLAKKEDGSLVSAVRGPSGRPPSASAKRSLADHAQFVECELIGRCVKGQTGDFAGQTWVRLDTEHIEALQQLSRVLAFMAPYDDAIRRTIQRARGNGEA